MLIVLTLAFAVSLAALVAVWHFVSMRQQVMRTHGSFVRVHIGATRQDVIDIMGEPLDIREGDALLRSDDGVLEGFEGLRHETCTEQYVYEVETFILPYIWVVDFKDGRVIAKFRMD